MARRRGRQAGYEGPMAGDIYGNVILLGRGHEQRGERPVVVIQDDDARLLSTRLCVPTSASADGRRLRAQAGDTSVVCATCPAMAWKRFGWRSELLHASSHG
jgi:mRNA-degrading endonuclease toxin of MazEF toxin-antitoxin module